MIKDYENNIINNNQPNAKDYPKRTIKLLDKKMIKDYENDIINNIRPNDKDYPKSTIKLLNKALKGYSRSYEISILTKHYVIFELYNSQNIIFIKTRT